MKRISVYTGTHRSQREERLHIRKRFAELAAKRGLPPQPTFREIQAGSVKEARGKP